MKYIVGLPFDFDDFTIEKLNTLSDEEKFLIADTNVSAVMYNSTKDFLQALNGDYVDTENLVWYEIEVENRLDKPFPITSVCRDDLECRGFNTDNITDDQMERLAGKMCDDYLEQMFWTSLDILAEGVINAEKREE